MSHDNQSLPANVKIQRTYLKQLTLNIPDAPHVFKQTGQLQTQVELKDTSQWLEGEIHEVILSLHIRGTLTEKLVYELMLDYTLVAEFQGFTPQVREQVMQTAMLAMLYPYALERANNVLVSSSLPAVQWVPINFEAMYQQRLQQQQAAGAAVSDAPLIVQ